MISLGGCVFLDPIHQRGEELVLLARRRLVVVAGEFRQRHVAILAVDCVSPALRAVCCARQQIHPHELLHFGVSAHRRGYTFVIVDVASRRDRVVGQADVDDHLAAEVAQLSKVRLQLYRVAQMPFQISRQFAPRKKRLKVAILKRRRRSYGSGPRPFQQS